MEVDFPAEGACQRFVGRGPELGETRAALREAMAGRGRLVLVAGEPGVGKTRLAEELSARALDEGALVLWGRCWDGGGAPAYWPWVQIIRGYARGRPRARLEADLGASAPFVAHLVPELRQRLPGVPVAALPAGSEEARFALLDAVTEFLATISVAAPLVLVLDDLHAADAPSLLLLQFLARELGSRRILVVGTFRDVGATPAPEGAAVLRGLLGAAQLVALHGLDVEAVRELLAGSAGSPAPAGAAEAVHRATGGNPLFLVQVMRLLDDDPARLVDTGAGGIPVPPGIREAIRVRVTRLPRDAVDALTLAAVVGEEVSRPLLLEASRLDPESLLEHLAAAVEAGLLVESADGLGRFRFAHALIRDAVYEALDAVARPALHRDVGHALERLHAADPGPHLAALAHHFCRAAPAREAEAGVEYAVRAAERGLQLLAYEDAAKHYELALATLELAGGPQASRRCEILLGLAAAEQRAGHAERARSFFSEAAALATATGDAERLADAALGLGAAEATVGAVDREAVELLESAHERLPPNDGPLRARVLARLARVLYFGDEEERRAELSRRAVEVARACDDPAALLEALCAEHVVTWDLDNPGGRLQAANEIVELAERLGDREAEIEGRLWRRRHLLELGDVLAADHEAAACERLATELRQPRYRWQVLNLRAGRALLAGRFDEAERLAHAALELGRTVRGATAEAAFLFQMRVVRSEQGRLEEVAPQIERLAELHAAWRLEPLYHLTKLGRTPEVRALFERHAARGFADLPRDMFGLWPLAYLAEACVHLSDRERADVLYDLLLPYRDRCLVMGQSAGCEGAIARHLGQLAALLERWEAAGDHFERALEIHTRMGARPLLAHTQHEYAGALLERGRVEDRDDSNRLLADALATAEELGMIVLAERLRCDGGSAQAEAGVFRKEGEYWTIAFESSRFRLKDARGLEYLARLLARPNEPIHALELAAAASSRAPRGLNPARFDEPGETVRRLGLGDAGEVLDSRAKAEYRRRRADLREELEEAESWGDPERAARASAELEFLTRELAGALGLGGRDRRAASPAERARVSVTKAIRRACAKIAEHDERLGDHLALTIRTGAFCSYAPGLSDARRVDLEVIAKTGADAGERAAGAAAVEPPRLEGGSGVVAHGARIAAPGGEGNLDRP